MLSRRISHEKRSSNRCHTSTSSRSAAVELVFPSSAIFFVSVRRIHLVLMLFLLLLGLRHSAERGPLEQPTSSATLATAGRFVPFASAASSPDCFNKEATQTVLFLDTSAGAHTVLSINCTYPSYLSVKPTIVATQLFGVNLTFVGSFFRSGLFLDVTLTMSVGSSINILSCQFANAFATSASFSAGSGLYIVGFSRSSLDLGAHYSMSLAAGTYSDGARLVLAHSTATIGYTPFISGTSIRFISGARLEIVNVTLTPDSRWINVHALSFSASSSIEGAGALFLIKECSLTSSGGTMLTSLFKDGAAMHVLGTTFTFVNAVEGSISLQISSYHTLLFAEGSRVVGGNAFFSQGSSAGSPLLYSNNSRIVIDGFHVASIAISDQRQAATPEMSYGSFFCVTRRNRIERSITIGVGHQTDLRVRAGVEPSDCGINVDADKSGGNYINGEAYAQQQLNVSTLEVNAKQCIYCDVYIFNVTSRRPSISGGQLFLSAGTFTRSRVVVERWAGRAISVGSMQLTDSSLTITNASALGASTLSQGTFTRSTLRVVDSVFEDGVSVDAHHSGGSVLLERCAFLAASVARALGFGGLLTADISIVVRGCEVGYTEVATALDRTAVHFSTKLATGGAVSFTRNVIRCGANLKLFALQVDGGLLTFADGNRGIGSGGVLSVGLDRTVGTVLEVESFSLTSVAVNSLVSSVPLVGVTIAFTNVTASATMTLSIAGLDSSSLLMRGVTCQGSLTVSIQSFSSSTLSLVNVGSVASMPIVPAAAGALVVDSTVEIVDSWSNASVSLMFGAAKRSSFVLRGLTIVDTTYSPALALITTSAGAEFSYSSLLVAGCKVSTAATTAVSVEVSSHSRSNHTWEGNVFSSELKNGNALLYETAKTSLSEGTLTLRRNTFSARYDLATEDCGAFVVLNAVGISVVYAPDNRIIGAFRLSMRATSPDTQADIAIESSEVHYLTYRLEKLTALIEKKGFRFHINNSRVGTVKDTSFAIASSLPSAPMSNLDIAVVDTTFPYAFGFNLQLVAGPCMACRIHVAKVSTQSFTLNAKPLVSGSSVLLKDINAQSRISVSASFQHNSSLRLRRCVVPAASVGAPLQLNVGPTGEEDHWFNDSALSVEDCTFATSMGSAAYSALYFGGTSAVLFARNYIATTEAGTSFNGALCFAASWGGGVVDRAASLTVIGNTLAVSSPSLYVFTVVSIGGRVSYTDNKCTSTGRLYFATADLSAPAPFLIDVRGHTSLSSIEVDTKLSNSTPSSPSASSQHCTSVTIIDCMLTQKLTVDLGPSFGSSLTVANTRVGGQTFVKSTSTELLSVNFTHNTFVDDFRVDLGGVERPAYTVPSSLLTIANSEARQSCLVTLSHRAETAFLGNTLRAAANFKGRVVGASIALAGNDWASFAGAYPFLLSLFVVVRCKLVIAANTVNTGAAPAFAWLQGIASDSHIWFDGNAWTATPTDYIRHVSVLNFSSSEGSTVRFTRNSINNGGAPMATIAASLAVDLNGGRIHHDATNAYAYGPGGVWVRNRGNAQGDVVILSGQSLMGFYYEALGSVRDAHIRFESCTIASLTPIRIALGTDAARVVVIVSGVSSGGRITSLEIEALRIDHSRLLVDRVEFAGGALKLWPRAVARANVSFVVQRSNFYLPHDILGDVSCPTNSAALRCIVAFWNNTHVTPGPTDANTPLLTVSGPFGDGTHVEVASNVISTTYSYTRPLLFVKISGIVNGGNLTLANNSVTAPAGKAAMEVGGLKASTTGSIELWGNTASGTFTISVGASTVHANLVGNRGEISASYTALNASLGHLNTRRAACNFNLAGALVNVPAAALINLPCTTSDVVARCPLIAPGDGDAVPIPPSAGTATSGSYIELRAVTEQFISCEQLRPSGRAMTDVAAIAAAFISDSPQVAVADRSLGVCWACSSPNTYVAFVDTNWVATTLSVDAASQCLSAAPETPRPRRLTATYSRSQRSSRSLSSLASHTATISSQQTCTVASLAASRSATPTQRGILTVTATATLVPSPTSLAALATASLLHVTPSTARLGSASKSVTATAAATTSHPPKVSHTPAESPSLVPSPTAALPQTPTLRVVKPIPATPVTDIYKGTALAVGAVTSVTAVVGISGGQLGVANAMVRLASCGGGNGDGDDDDDDDTADDVPVLVHPLRFSVFSRRDGPHGADGAYIAAALSNTVVVPLAVALLARGPAVLFLRLLRGVPEREALVTMGWPGVVMTPFVTLAEGTGVSVVRALRSGTAVGVVFGLLGAVTTAVFVALWARVLLVVVPRWRVALVPNEEAPRLPWLVRAIVPMRVWMPRGEGEGEEKDEAEKVSSGPPHLMAANASFTTALLAEGGVVPDDGGDEMAMMAPASTASDATEPVSKSFPSSARHAAPPPPFPPTAAPLRVSEDDLERYGNTLGDKRLFYAELASFGCSLLVGVCEGVPDEHCKARAVVAVAAAERAVRSASDAEADGSVGDLPRLPKTRNPNSVSASAAQFCGEARGGATTPPGAVIRLGGARPSAAHPYAIGAATSAAFGGDGGTNGGSGGEEEDQIRLLVSECFSRSDFGPNAAKKIHV